ncbi:MAG: MalY/PatB family protein [Sporolactobacillus sp.]
MSGCSFDRIICRDQTNSVKWDGAEERFGRPELLPLWIADMDFCTADPILDEMKRVLEHGIFGYTRCPSTVKTAIQSWLLRLYQWNVARTSIVFNHNVVSSIALALRALTLKGDKILILSPVYNPFFEQIEQLGRQVVKSELVIKDGRYAMDLEDMEDKINQEKVRCLLFCSPHNPGGRVWNKEELEAVLLLAENYQIPIISDEIHSDLILPGGKHQPIGQMAVARNVKVVTLMAPTKTFNLAGIGPSYLLIFDPEIRKTIQALQKSMVYPEISPFQIAAMTAAYTKGEKWLTELLDYIAENIAYVISAFAGVDELYCIRSEATYLMWVRYADLGVTESELNTAFLENGVALQMGSTYGESGNGYFRMNIAAPQATVVEGTRRILNAVQQLKESRVNKTSAAKSSI